MKKTLALILMICLVVTLVPTAFADDTVTGLTIKYDLSAAMKAEGMTTLSKTKTPSEIDYEDTNGLLDVVSYGIGAEIPDNNWFYYQRSTTADSDHNIVMRANKVLAMEIYVPEDGTYQMVAHRGYNNSDKGVVEVYIAEGAFSDAYKWNAGTKFGQYECYGSNHGFARLADVTVHGIGSEEPATIELKAGKYVVAFERVGMEGYYGSVGGFSLVSGDGSGFAIVNGKIAGVDSEISIGENAKIIATGNSSANGKAITDFSFSSSNDSVVTVDESGNLIAINPGVATVYATAAGALNSIEKKIVVIDPNSLDKNITVAIDDNGDGIATVNGTYKRGDKLSVTARSIPGKEFRAWVRGSAENGLWVSSKQTYEFDVMTNTYITAVYSDAPQSDSDVVEYYNWNGAFLGTEEPTGAKAPSLIGYVFNNNWKNGGKTGNVIRKVAEFVKGEAIFNITVDKTSDIEEDGGTYYYDDKVTFNSKSGEAVYWLRDGKVVDFGTSYTFYVWDDTYISTALTGKNSAKIILDKTKGDAVMVEYDAGDVNIVEVGIIFGREGTTPTVSSCDEKMNSQRNLLHGQFTASSEYTVARGYIIYDAGDAYKVIYTD